MIHSIPGRSWLFLVLLAAGLPAGARAQDLLKPKSPKYEKLYQELLRKAEPSKELKQGWYVEGPSYLAHSTISKEYTVAMAIHLHRFHERFKKIFQGDFKANAKPAAYAFASEKEYLAFSPESKGSQGRYTLGPKKNLAWFSTPPGEKEFYRTDFGVVQHEATHQLLDAYTDNPGIPDWFHEGCASFFEDWDLDQKDEANILAGIDGRYGLGICLTYPKQPAPPQLREYWVDLRKMFERQKFQKLYVGVEKWPPDPGEDLDYKKHQVFLQQYNEAWAIITFLVHHKTAGRQFFNKFLAAFREGADNESLRAKYLTEDFLKDFEKAWEDFLKKEVLKKWDLACVGGQKVKLGDPKPPPPATEGYPLAASRRGDLFLVRAEKGKVPPALAPQTWWMLQAWSVPVRFYQDAWKKIPELSRGGPVMVNGAYALREHRGDHGAGTRVFYLMPLWRDLTLDQDFEQRLAEAAGKLVAKGTKG